MKYKTGDIVICERIIDDEPFEEVPYDALHDRHRYIIDEEIPLKIIGETLGDFAYKIKFTHRGEEYTEYFAQEELRRAKISKWREIIC